MSRYEQLHKSRSCWSTFSRYMKINRERSKRKRSWTFDHVKNFTTVSISLTLCSRRLCNFCERSATTCLQSSERRTAFSRVGLSRFIHPSADLQTDLLSTRLLAVVDELQVAFKKCEILQIRKFTLANPLTRTVELHQRLERSFLEFIGLRFPAFSCTSKIIFNRARSMQMRLVFSMLENYKKW